jgi:hypothetical protein
MNLGLKTGLLGGACALALVAFGVPAYAQDDIVTLRQQLDAMKERLAKLEADKQEKRRVAAAAAVEAGDKPRSWKLPGTNTSMNIGGFIKFSAIYHLDGGAARSGGTNRDAIALYGLLNNDGSAADNRFNNGHWNLTARRSRFWIQTWTPTDWGELRTYLEGDFAEVGPGVHEILRLRHAYGTLGPVLAGQTWSTFYPVFAWPELLDDGGPALGANPGPTRRAQIRYTHNFGGGLTADLALEAPIATGNDAFISGAATTGDQIAGGTTGGQRWPILVAALEWVQPTFRVRVAGMIHQIEHDNGCQTGALPPGLGAVGGACAGTLASNDTAIGWGFNAGFTWNTPVARLQIGGAGFIGKGMGALSGHLDAVVRGQFDIRTVWALGGALWAQYGLTDTIRATGVFGYHASRCSQAVASGAHNTDETFCAAAGAPANFSDEWYAAGNLLWNPVPQVTFGVEYLYAFSNRYAGPNARANRIHFAAIYRF